MVDSGGAALLVGTAGVDVDCCGSEVGCCVSVTSAAVTGLCSAVEPSSTSIGRGVAGCMFGVPGLLVDVRRCRGVGGTAPNVG